MERFSETLDSQVTTQKLEEIGKQMVAEISGKKSKLDLTRFDWSRCQGCDLRDSRSAGEPCMGRHQLAPFARGSLSGSNGHALWMMCSRCALRLMYVPTWAAKGCYRSPGPLMADVKDKLETTPNATAEELRTKSISLDGAEASALRKLEAIQKEKIKVKEATGKKVSQQSAQKPALSTPPKTSQDQIDLTEGPMTVETGPKKTVKREHTLPAEQQEQEGTTREWIQVSP